MTKELLNTEVEVATEKSEEVELGFVESITLVNNKGAKRVIKAPESVPGHVYREAIKLQYEEKKLNFKHDGKENYERDEEGKLIPVVFTFETEEKILNLYENLAVMYFNDQFTLEELQNGLDARKYQGTLTQIFASALGNAIVPLENQAK
ncbi:hypothetical protein ERX35_007835 [Macrococcus equipercicus]|uniref:Phage portal protein n=1 Tax=Macrococcus equipercicus TaxID=69967 RepID=A0ABQ6R7Q4_9STAP|nr:hypothetical protein [Macrococcus equipercicus]KAA1039117.1 hypothetical protein ERX35_007835 [Macrococcus equipercicus]